MARTIKKRINRGAADRLLMAVDGWLKSVGGLAIVAGDIGIMPTDIFNSNDEDGAQRFYVVIRVLGRKPKKQAQP